MSNFSRNHGENLLKFHTVPSAFFPSIKWPKQSTISPHLCRRPAAAMGTHSDITGLLVGNHGNARLEKIGWRGSRLRVTLSKQVAVRTKQLLPDSVVATLSGRGR